MVVLVAGQSAVATVVFPHRDIGPNGELDDWHEFVKRAIVPQLTISGRSTIVEDW
jgi:hypothetical protein